MKKLWNSFLVKMIKDKVFYGVQCDGCGKVLLGEYDIPLYYESPEYIEETAIDSGWKKLRGKHYCPDCYQYGDNDELILADSVVIMPEEDDWE